MGSCLTKDPRPSHQGSDVLTKAPGPLHHCSFALTNALTKFRFETIQTLQTLESKEKSVNVAFIKSNAFGRVSMSTAQVNVRPVAEKQTMRIEITRFAIEIFRFPDNSPLLQHRVPYPEVSLQDITVAIHWAVSTG